MELNELPDELLLHIFFCLPLHSLFDVARLTLTCQKWRRILWSQQFLQQIGSFKYQSRFLIYRCPLHNDIKENSLHKYLEFDQSSSIPYLTINGYESKLKQDIENCPLVNMTISMWCRSLNHISLLESTVFLLWHFHLGYVGFYRDAYNNGYARVRCTYTKQHQLNTNFTLKLNEWYHIAIVIKENKSLRLWINGNKINEWPLEENINRQNLSIAPYSSTWFASHCGASQWYGSLFDICLWKRCLEPYEIERMARIRTNIEEINFISQLQL